MANKGGSSRPASFFSNLQWEVLVSGMTGGAVSTVVLHPLDLLKIRFQVNEGTGVTRRPTYRGLFDALRSIISAGGIRALYQGLVPNLIGSSASWGFYFFLYQARKSQMQGQDATRMLSAPEHMLAAAQAGATTLVLTNPIWVTKTRLCLQYDAQVRGAMGRHQGDTYRGMLHALSAIWRSEGVRGFYKGLLPGFLGVSHGIIQFVAYEDLKNRYHNHLNQPPNKKLSTWAYLTFSAVSKLIAASTTYPYQVVRSRLQDQHRCYNGVADVIVQTWRFEGVRGFYKGLLPSLLRVTPACCITFVVYENLSHWLQTN